MLSAIFYSVISNLKVILICLIISLQYLLLPTFPANLEVFLGYVGSGAYRRVTSTSISTTFTSVFDGDGYAISGLWINWSNETNIELFGVVKIVR